MIKKVMDNVCVFDVEFAPCLATGRRVYCDPGEQIGDKEVLERMYAGAPADRNGRRWEVGDAPPMLKTLFYEVLCVSAVFHRRGQAPVLRTLSQTDAQTGEAQVVGKFLGSVAEKRYQLAGFASSVFDVPVLAQRALVHGLVVPPFFDRPAKPWDGPPDYLSPHSEWHVDLLKEISGWDGKTRPKLDEVCRACGLPGKLGMQGEDVAPTWWSGEEGRKRTVEYCETDACSTYLLFLRMAALSGALDYKEEAGKFREQLVLSGRAHLGDFLAQWSFE